jgi:hypothetical protein
MNSVSTRLADETYRRLREEAPGRDSKLGRTYWRGYDHPYGPPPGSAAVRSSSAYAAWRAGCNARRAERKLGVP